MYNRADISEMHNNCIAICTTSVVVRHKWRQIPIVWVNPQHSNAEVPFLSGIWNPISIENRRFSFGSFVGLVLIPTSKRIQSIGPPSILFLLSSKHTVSKTAANKGLIFLSSKSKQHPSNIFGGNTLIGSKHPLSSYPLPSSLRNYEQLQKSRRKLHGGIWFLQVHRWCDHFRLLVSFGSRLWSSSISSIPILL